MGKGEEQGRRRDLLVLQGRAAHAVPRHQHPELDLLFAGRHDRLLHRHRRQRLLMRVACDPATGLPTGEPKIFSTTSAAKGWARRLGGRRRRRALECPLGRRRASTPMRPTASCCARSPFRQTELLPGLRRRRRPTASPSPRPGRAWTTRRASADPEAGKTFLLDCRSRAASSRASLTLTVGVGSRWRQQPLAAHADPRLRAGSRLPRDGSTAQTVFAERRALEISSYLAQSTDLAPEFRRDREGLRRPRPRLPAGGARRCGGGACRPRSATRRWSGR